MHDSGESAFDRKLVKRMMDRPGYPLTKTVRHIFVSIDPNAGGDSRFGICSCIYERGQMVIVGLDAVKSKNPAEYEPVLTEHLLALRNHPLTARAIIVMMVESNLGFEAFHIQRFLKRSRLARYTVCMSDKDQKTGLRTTNPVKEAMWIKLRTYLEEDAVCFWDKLVSVNPEKTPKQMRKELQEELNNYKVMTELAKTVFQETKRTFTGKIGGAVDDLSVTLQLNALCKLTPCARIVVVFVLTVHLHTQGTPTSSRRSTLIFISSLSRSFKITLFSLHSSRPTRIQLRLKAIDLRLHHIRHVDRDELTSHGLQLSR
tara:strand:- start:13886 stop:14833 length:948 start_codon:yes stop_codon:yes gene_type:complete